MLPPVPALGVTVKVSMAKLATTVQSAVMAPVVQRLPLSEPAGQVPVTLTRW